MDDVPFNIFNISRNNDIESCSLDKVSFQTSIAILGPWVEFSILEGWATISLSMMVGGRTLSGSKNILGKLWRWNPK